ncbi:DUF5681 domain-containing protein [Novosphingobium sp. MW5]|nr:DUF5681 domain-containing protein [Novosphingobium sp. MW5]
MAEDRKPKGQDDDAVGYGKPPRSGQIKKGEIRNLKGRPRKAKAKPLVVPQYLPTQKAIRKSGQRVHQVKVNGEVTEMSGYDAAMNVLFQMALKGGPMAMRLYLSLQREEDARQAVRQEGSFEFWKDYHPKAKAEVKAAQAAGDPEPDLVPHPDDIVLDYEDRRVRFNGPIDEEENGHYLEQRRIALLCWEMTLYTQEQDKLDPDDFNNSKIGFWMLNYLIRFIMLPVRMRHPTKKEELAVINRGAGWLKGWEDYLISQCKSAGLPFRERGTVWPTMTVGELGLERLLVT